MSMKVHLQQPLRPADQQRRRVGRLVPLEPGADALELADGVFPAADRRRAVPAAGGGAARTAAARAGAFTCSPAEAAPAPGTAPSRRPAGVAADPFASPGGADSPAASAWNDRQRLQLLQQRPEVQRVMVAGLLQQHRTERRRRLAGALRFVAAPGRRMRTHQAGQLRARHRRRLVVRQSRDSQCQFRIPDAAGAGRRPHEGHRPQVPQQAAQDGPARPARSSAASDRGRRPGRAAGGRGPSAARSAGGSAPAIRSVPAGPPGPSGRAPAGRRPAGPASAPSAPALSRGPAASPAPGPAPAYCRSAAPACRARRSRAPRTQGRIPGCRRKASQPIRPSVIDSKSTKASSRRKARAKARPDEDDRLQRLRDNLSLPAKCKQAIPPCSFPVPAPDYA